MIYTPLLHRAIKFAIKTHDVYQKQKRKGKDVAYITHPLTVGIILAHAGASEEVIAAGILHDTIEDSAPTKKVTEAMLQARFGSKVSQLVLSVTEQDKKVPWDVRKQEALHHIEHFSHDELLLKSADVISNVSEILDDQARYGDTIFDRFSVPKSKLLTHYSNVIETILARWDKNPLQEDLVFLKERMQDIS
jgi:(p)ppGpp synthase/HD superfamily hydrolase